MIASYHTGNRSVANGDQKALGRHRGVAEHLDDRIRPVDAVQVHGCSTPGLTGDMAVHFGRLAQQHIEGHVHRVLAGGLVQAQMRVVGGHADHGEWAAFARAQGAESIERCGRNGQHIPLLAFVAPNLAR